MARINLDAAVAAADRGERIADISQALDAAQASGRIDAYEREQLMQQLGAGYDTTDDDTPISFLRGLLGIGGRK